MTEREALQEFIKAEKHYRLMVKFANELGGVTAPETARLALIASTKAREMYEAIRETSF